MLCGVSDCSDGGTLVRGLCSRHYRSLLHNRDPFFVDNHPFHGRSNQERFWSFVGVRGPDECWIWRGARNHENYGTFRERVDQEVGRNQQYQMAHRYSYMLLVGPIPDGYEVDHLCHNWDESCDGGPTCPHRPCVNPRHLEAVTPAENVARRRQFNAKKTHCKWGHPFDETNTIYEKNGDRQCHICRLRRKRGYRARDREKRRQA